MSCCIENSWVRINECRECHLQQIIMLTYFWVACVRWILFISSHKTATADTQQEGWQKNQTNWRDILTAMWNKDCTYKLAGVLELSYPTDIQMAFSLLENFLIKLGMLCETLEHLTAN